MKEIKAFIKPHKLYDVTKAVKEVEKLRGMSVAEVKGFGRREKDDRRQAKIDELMDFTPYIRIEIYCYDDVADEIVSIIEKTAFTGLRGDGKIYVSDIEKAFKIGKGEIDESVVS